MRVKSPFKWRRSNAAKRWAVAMMIGMALSPITSLLVQQTTVQAQTAPTGAGFVIDAGDLRFIYEQILVAQDHAAGGQLLGPGPNQVHDPQLPRGLRTVDGSFNNLVPVPDQHLFGAADRLFPRLLTPRFRTAQNGTSYQQIGGTVIDSEPRTITRAARADLFAANRRRPNRATRPARCSSRTSRPTSASRRRST